MTDRPETPPHEIKSEMGEIKVESSEHDISADDKHRRGWFDIVMGSSNEHDSSEDDEGSRKRKYVSYFGLANLGGL
jgi:hypothetical protein